MPLRTVQQHPLTRWKDRTDSAARWLAVLLLLLLFLHAHGWAQGLKGTGNLTTRLYAGVPIGSCTSLQAALDTTTGDFYTCKNGAWNKIGGGAVGGIPSGMITYVDTGACPAGFTEVAAAGAYIMATVAASGDVGTTGGSSTVPAQTFTGDLTTVPAETVNSLVAAAPAFTGDATTVPAETVNALTAAAQTVNSLTAAAQVHTGDATAIPALAVGTLAFAGSPLATHQHELPFQDPTAAGTTNFRGTAAATFGTGTSRAAVWGVTTTSVTTAAAVAMSQAISAGTPSGSITGATATGTLIPLGHNATSAVTGTMNSSAVTGTLNSTSITPLGHNATSAVTGTLNSTTATPLGHNSSVTVTPPYLKLIACKKT